MTDVLTQTPLTRPRKSAIRSTGNSSRQNGFSVSGNGVGRDTGGAYPRFSSARTNRRKNMIDIYSDSISDKEIEALLAQEVSGEWLKNTPEGKQFNRHYSSEQNRKKLAEVFGLLDEAVSPETLSAAFRKLVASGALRTEQEIREDAEQAERERNEANRAKWESQCSEWIDSHSTREITERAKTDRAFRSYLKAANQIPQLAVEYSAEAVARQQDAKKIQKQKDTRFDNISDELWTFAENYKRLPAAEALKRMKEPPFKAAVEACAKAGIL
jgi:hypothetical protein